MECAVNIIVTVTGAEARLDYRQGWVREAIRRMKERKGMRQPLAVNYWRLAPLVLGNRKDWFWERRARNDERRDSKK